MNTGSATLKDVARLAGVNDATVSRAFSGSAPVAIQTRKRILQAAHSLGYRPSVAARATRTGRTGFVGMVQSVALPNCIHAPEFMVGVHEALNDRDLALVTGIIDDADPEPDIKAPRIVRENAVDGLLVNYAFGTPPALAELLDRCHIPTVWINQKRETNCVRPNDEAVAYEATRCILEHGHRRVVWIDARSDGERPHDEQHYSRADRLDGYRRAMREGGLTSETVTLTVPKPGTPGCVGRICDAYTEYLKRPDRPSAVLCAGGGREMVAAAWRLGLSVPGDLSVMTFDNDTPSDALIGVDRVLVPYTAMGRAAIEQLCKLIEQPDRPQRSILLPFHFHRTGSVARPQPDSPPG